jgi:hypothetical protein
MAVAVEIACDAGGHDPVVDRRETADRLEPHLGRRRNGKRD